MELTQAILERRSIRKFTDQEISKELIAKLVEQASWAPTGMNRQAWKFLVLHGAKLEEFLQFSAGLETAMEGPLQRENFSEKMRKFIHGYFKSLGGAKWALIILSKSADSYVEDHANMMSAGAAMQNFLLLAHEAGLGTCWMTGYTAKEDDFMKFLGISGYKLAGVTPIGYSDQTPPVPPRKNSEITWLE